MSLHYAILVILGVSLMEERAARPHLVYRLPLHFQEKPQNQFVPGICVLARHHYMLPA